MTHKVLNFGNANITNAIKQAAEQRKKSPWKAFRESFWASMRKRDFLAPFNAYKAVKIGKRAGSSNAALALAFEAFKDKKVLDQLKKLQKENFTHITVNAKGELIAEKLTFLQAKAKESGPKEFYQHSNHVQLSEIFNLIKVHNGAKIRADLEAAGTPIGFAPKP